MTFEKKCLIEPSDIAAVHFECSECGTEIVVPIGGGYGTGRKNGGFLLPVL